MHRREEPCIGFAANIVVLLEEQADSSGKAPVFGTEPSCLKERRDIIFMEKNFDNVNHPKHYISKNGLETIDVIEAFTEDLEGFEAVCTANVLKYMCRWKQKNGIEDLKKAEWYLKRLIKGVEKAAKNAAEKALIDACQGPAIHDLSFNPFDCMKNDKEESK